MKKQFVIPILWILFCNITSAQEFKINRETQQLIENRDIHLNGGMRSQFGGKSRTYIQVDLPENTVKWMYSFSTAKGQNGTQDLNLLTQIGGMIADPSGFTSDMLSEIKVPEGVATIDVYLCNRPNIDKFLDKSDLNGDTYYYTMEGTVENTKAAVVEIDDVISGTVFLGLKNPSSMNGVHISIEVVAITETKVAIPKTKEQEKAELYGSLAWTHFKNGDYPKCIEYCDKSKKEYALGWVLGNKGLAQLMELEEEKAFESYLEAIPLIKEQPNPKKTFRKILEDIDNAIEFCIQLNGASEIKELIKLQVD